MTDRADQFLALELGDTPFDHEAHVRVPYALVSRRTSMSGTIELWNSC